MTRFFSKLYAFFPGRLLKRASKDALPDNFKSTFKSTSADTDELMNDLFKSERLHRQLLVKYHPDLLLDPEKKEIADELCKEINENRNNYKRLKELESECKNRLF